MTQQVTDQAGLVHEFPDEATPDMISDALGLAKSQPQEFGLWKSVARMASAPTPGTETGGPFSSEAVTARQEGLKQGVRDVGASLNPVSTYVEKKLKEWGVPESVLTAGGAFPTAEKQAAADTEAKKAFEKKYTGSIFDPGGTGEAQQSRFVGSLIPTIPIMGTAQAGLRALGPVGRLLAGEQGYQKGGSFLTRRASDVLSGATQGAEAGAVLSGGSDENVGPQVLRGAEFGAGIGGGIGALRTPTESILRAPINPLVAETAEKAGKLGVDLRGGQITSSRGVQRLDSAIAHSGNDEQLADFTRAVSRTFGADSPALTKETMNGAADKIGNGLTQIAKRTGITTDQTLLDHLTDLETQANKEFAPGSPELATVKQRLNQVIDEALTGDISGETYQSFTKRNSTLDRMRRDQNPNIAFYGGKLRGILDDALERSSTPADITELKQLRGQWKNMVTVEDLAEKSQPTGILDPKLLAGAVRKKFEDYGYTGAGDLGVLSEAGKFLASPTAQGGVKVSHGSFPLWAKLAGGGLAGSELLQMMHQPKEAAIGAAVTAGGLTGAKLAGSYLASPAYRNRLVDLSLGRTGPRMVNPLIPSTVDLYNRLPSGQ